MQCPFPAALCAAAGSRATRWLSQVCSSTFGGVNCVTVMYTVAPELSKCSLPLLAGLRQVRVGRASHWLTRSGRVSAVQISSAVCPSRRSNWISRPPSP